MKWNERARSVSALEVPAGRAFVYVAWGIDTSVPLYVGKSRSLMTRIGHHALKSRWWPYLKRLEVYAYPDDREALKAEAEAIAELQPEYNRMLRGGAPPTPNYMRRRWQPYPMVYGPSITTDEISEDQLAVIARVQNRGRVA